MVVGAGQGMEMSIGDDEGKKEGLGPQVSTIDRLDERWS